MVPVHCRRRLPDALQSHRPGMVRCVIRYLPGGTATTPPPCDCPAREIWRHQTLPRRRTAHIGLAMAAERRKAPEMMLIAAHMGLACTAALHRRAHRRLWNILAAAARRRLPPAARRPPPAARRLPAVCRSPPPARRRPAAKRHLAMEAHRGCPAATRRLRSGLPLPAGRWPFPLPLARRRPVPQRRHQRWAEAHGRSAATRRPRLRFAVACWPFPLPPARRFRPRSASPADGRKLTRPFGRHPPFPVTRLRPPPAPRPRASSRRLRPPPAARALAHRRALGPPSRAARHHTLSSSCRPSLSPSGTSSSVSSH